MRACGVCVRTGQWRKGGRGGARVGNGRPAPPPHASTATAALTERPPASAAVHRLRDAGSAGVATTTATAAGSPSWFVLRYRVPHALHRTGLDAGPRRHWGDSRGERGGERASAPGRAARHPRPRRAATALAGQPSAARRKRGDTGGSARGALGGSAHPPAPRARRRGGRRRRLQSFSPRSNTTKAAAAMQLCQRPRDAGVRDARGRERPPSLLGQVAATPAAGRGGRHRPPPPLKPSQPSLPVVAQCMQGPPGLAGAAGARARPPARRTGPTAGSGPPAAASWAARCSASAGVAGRTARPQPSVRASR